jgi:hypothetical protein
VLYTRSVPREPPGFYIDESSIAYNAHAISIAGCDEYGVQWPLYFRAFGEFKNPTYIYLLAVIFKITGPSIFVARLFSALLGLAAALLLGLLAWRLARDLAAAMTVTLSALLTPWLFESSRLVFEVAAYPVVVVAFLLVLQRAAARKFWSAFDITAIATTLGLLTYTYSIGRLLGPLLAAGLILFASKGNRRAVGLTLTAYLVGLIPVMIFVRHYPGALTSRLSGITYLNAQAPVSSIALEFVKHYAADINPWTMLVKGENNVRDHIAGMGPLLIATFGFAVAGLVVVLRRLRSDPWWRFIVYALIVSIIPAALTENYFPQLRLVVFPLLLHVLMVPGVQLFMGTGGLKLWTVPRVRLAFAIAVIGLVAQGAYFQYLFHRDSPDRWYFMDARFARKILEPAVALNRRPIYLYDPTGHPGYIQSLWHGTLRGLAGSDFIRISTPESVPAGSVVISTQQTCTNCRLMARSFNYVVYVALPSDLHPNFRRLPAEAFRADVSLRQVPSSLTAGHEAVLPVSVRNLSGASWTCIGDDDGHYVVDVRARWRNENGAILAEAGRAFFVYDLEPGDVNDVDLQVAAPAQPGNYILEIDLVQEPDQWLSANGGKPLSLPIRVN